MENARKQENHIDLKNNTRSGIRWLMLFYDSVVYLLCWIAVIVLHPSLRLPLPASTCWFYFGVGYAAFFGLRFAVRSYNQIWRFGAIQTFAREIFSGFFGSCIVVLISMFLGDVFEPARITFITVAMFSAIYVLISVALRVLYCYLFRFASQDVPGAKMVRSILRNFALVDFSSKKPGGILHIVLESEDNNAAPINELQNIAEQFAIRGDITSITQINKGYINRTYRVETLSDAGHVHKYTLQRINTNVFPDVDALMDNFKLTTQRLQGRLLLPGRRKRGAVQTHRTTKDGRAYLRDDSGCWRMLTHFDGVYSLDIPDRPDTFYQAGNAFGMFLKEMSGVDPKDVKVVIPNFHNTKSRYNDLEVAVEKNPKDRVKNVLPEIEFVRARADKYGIISDALDSGEIPTRVCHNDTNLNNILFDSETHMPVAIIDLDTVMPSSPLYDFGDSMRIGTNTAKDDEKDLSKVSCDLDLYERYARGYLEACGDVLTRKELELLPYAALIITVEDGIRFLMDHINGDTYYNIYYPGQNLDRARTQLKLVADMETKLPQIRQILQKIYDDLKLDAKVV